MAAPPIQFVDTLFIRRETSITGVTFSHLNIWSARDRCAAHPAWPLLPMPDGGKEEVICR
jgi:hypothetical protein